MGARRKPGRPRKSTNDPRWRLKPGMGTHRFIRKDTQDKYGLPFIVEPGDVIQCPRVCIGAAADKFIQLTPDPPEDVGPSPNVGLRVEHIGGGYYDVVNEATGRPINGKRLTRGEARDLARLAGSPTSDQTPEARSGEIFADTGREEAQGDDGDTEHAGGAKSPALGNPEDLGG